MNFRDMIVSFLSCCYNQHLLIQLVSYSIVPNIEARLYSRSIEGVNIGVLSKTTFAVVGPFVGFFYLLDIVITFYFTRARFSVNTSSCTRVSSWNPAHLLK